MNHSAVRRPGRHVFIAGRSMTDLIRSILDQRIGFVADMIDAGSILLSLLEEHFYGGSFKDDFYEALSAYSVPTDAITQTRKEILTQLAEQVRAGLGEMNPRYQYTFRLIPGGDVMVSEVPPWPVFGEHIFGGETCKSSSPLMTFGDAILSKA